MLKPKRIVILLCILAGLIAVFAWVTTSTDPAISGKLFRIGKDDAVKTVDIENEYGTFRFFEQDGAWVVQDGEQTYRTNPEKMKLLLDDLNQFAVERILQTETEEYGLTPGRARLHVTTQQGESIDFVVGNMAPSMSSAYIKGGDTVGITSAARVAQMDGSLAAYRDKNVFAVDVNNLANIGYYEDGKLKVSMLADGDSWVLDYPYSAPARSIVMNEILAMLRGWQIAGFPDMRQVSLEEMQLATPKESLVLVDAQGNSQVLDFGSEAGTARYVRTGGEDDISMLYTADIDLTQFDDSKLLFVAPLRVPVTMVSRIDMTVDGATFAFEVNDEAQTATLNGRYIDYQDFLSIYTKYTLLLADGYDAEGAQDKTVVAQFTTTLADGQQAQLALYARDAQSYFMGIGDNSSFYMNKERLDALMEKVNALGAS